MRRTIMDLAAGLVLVALLAISDIFSHNLVVHLTFTELGLAVYIGPILTIVTSALAFYQLACPIRDRVLPAAELRPDHQKAQRHPMINLVRRIWIGDFLEPSLRDWGPIELYFVKSTEGGASPDSGSEQTGRPAVETHSTIRILDHFEHACGPFLILGDPGSGRTTLLLQLAGYLLDRAEEQPHHPIPVVFNLSSWASRRGSLDVWMADELERLYQIPPSLGRWWIADNAVLPLLDGLDEVDLPYREECAAAISEFERTWRPLPLVICGGKDDYAALKGHLDILTAICIEPLSHDQITEYIGRAGIAAEEFLASLDGRTVLCDLLRTPFMLKSALLAYSSNPQGLNGLVGSAEDQRRQILDCYRKAAFDRPSLPADTIFGSQGWGGSPQESTSRKVREGMSAGSSRRKAERWIRWLARSMKRANQSIFHLDWMQPELLDIPGLLQVYILLYWLAVGSAFGLVFGPAIGLAFRMNYGFEADPLFFLSRGLSIILCFGLVGGLVVGIIDILAREIPVIRPVEEMNFKFDASKLLGHSLFGMVSGGVGGMMGGLAAGLIFALVRWLASGQLRGADFELAGLVGAGLILGLVVGLCLGLAEGIGLCGMPAVPRLGPLPNQGMRRSARLSSGIALISVLSVISLWMLQEAFAFFHPWLEAMGIALVELLPALLAVMVIVPVFLAYSYGGAACISHCLLRIMLWLCGCAPLHYLGFLEAAADRGLLKRVGGGYAFIHRIMLDYFTSLETDRR